MGTTVIAWKFRKKGIIGRKRVKLLTSAAPGPSQGPGPLWRERGGRAQTMMLWVPFCVMIYIYPYLLASVIHSPTPYTLCFLPHVLWLLSCTNQPLALVIGWTNLSYQLLPVSESLRISEWATTFRPKKIQMTIAISNT